MQFGSLEFESAQVAAMTKSHTHNSATAQGFYILHGNSSPVLPVCLSSCDTDSCQVEACFFQTKSTPNSRVPVIYYHYSPFLMTVLGPKPVLISTPFWPWQDSADHVVLLCWILSCALFPPQFTWRIRRGCPNKTIKTYGTCMIYVHKLEYSTCGIL